MTAAEAIQILRQHNAWRRGARHGQAPQQIGIAIDVLCAEAERLLSAAQSAAPMASKPANRQPPPPPPPPPPRDVRGRTPKPNP